MIATDGCLGRDGRSINITSKEREFLAQVQIAIGSRGCISHKFGGSRQLAYQLQFKSRSLWEHLWEIGLTPKKSLTIGPLRVPDEGFRDFLRGAIDGDGNIRRWQHPTNGREQWRLQVYGASQPFLRWLQETTKRLWHVTGSLHVRPPASERHHPLYILKFGKIAAKVILTECYYPNALALERKRALAIECVAATVGWSRSKTVQDSKRWGPWKYVHSFVRPSKSTFSKSGDIDPTAGLIAEDIPRWWAGVAKLAEARDLKSCVPIGTCGFDSHPRHLSS